MSRVPEDHSSEPALIPRSVYDIPWIGPWKGRVVENNDPQKRGEILVVVPEVSGEDVPMGALPAQGGGKKPGPHGVLWVPEVGDWVWVMYENGDAGHPIYLGGWWAEDELPSLFQVNYPRRRGWISPSGHYLVFDDSDEALGDVFLAHRDGGKLWLRGDGDAELSAKDGQILYLQESQTDGEQARGVAREEDEVDCGSLVVVAVANGAIQITYTPAGAAVPDPPYTLGQEIPLRGRIKTASKRTRTR